MNTFRINLRNVALTVACLAVSMMLVSGCKKDKKDDNGGNGDNLFAGTWNSDDDAGVTLEFTANMWMLKSGGVAYGSGNYTYTGNTATLMSESPTGVIEVGTAKVSDKTLTLTVEGVSQRFTRDSGGGGGGGGTTYGTGTASDPFKVSTVADLKRVGSGEEGPGGKEWKQDKFYLQTANIDLSSEENWTPICNTIYSFTGNYNGGGYTISNLTNSEEEDNTGLFNAVGGTVQNVRLNKVDFFGKGNVGAVAAKVYNGGKIDHCSVNDFYITGTGSLGGIAGTNALGATVSNCIVTNGTVFTTTGFGFHIGGVIGSNDGMVQNCYSTIDVSGNYPVGGIVGSNTGHGMVQYCYTTGNVTSRADQIGGISGSGGSIQNCVALNKEIRKPSTSNDDDIGRITRRDGDGLLNNYAREDMILTSNNGTPIPVTNATTTGKDGADVLPVDYNGANSGTWWKNTVGFPESSWDFAPNRLPILKGFNGLNQNPTVTP